MNHIQSADIFVFVISNGGKHLQNIWVSRNQDFTR